MFKEQKGIVGTHIQRIVDFDEITNHYLQVFVSHCVRKKGVVKDKDEGKSFSQNMRSQSGSDDVKNLVSEAA